MNIFHLDKNPVLCAKWLCDKHCVKMVLETAQMLCTGYQKNFGIKNDLYKTAFPKHPMTIWVGNSRGNFQFTFDLFKNLLDEYTYRYNKIHKCQKIYDLLNSKYNNWQSDMFGIMSNPPLCMPDEYKIGDYVESYRRYYIGAKKKLAKYNHSEPPYWLGDLIKEQRKLVKVVSYAK
tara:strand:- start:14 stop:541 length:528 start_codon:yes stop_codon:yes gene_type:complete